MSAPDVWWSESMGLLRRVDDEVRGPQGVLPSIPADAVRLVPAPRPACYRCASMPMLQIQRGCPEHDDFDTEAW